MSPQQYDAWYDTARGRHIGDTEFRLLARILQGRPGESLLDVGCGTGWFTRRFAANGFAATGLDIDPAMLAFARSHARGESYLEGDARVLPFPDRAFDLTISVTALCFVPEELLAVREMLRVTRRRFTIGLLNRHSLLYLQRGRHGGSGSYRGARWHTTSEVRGWFHDLPVTDLRVETAVPLPGAGRLARWLEPHLHTPWGAFLSVSGSMLQNASAWR